MSRGGYSTGIEWRGKLEQTKITDLCMVPSRGVCPAGLIVCRDTSFGVIVYRPTIDGPSFLTAARNPAKTSKTNPSSVETLRQNPILMNTFVHSSPVSDDVNSKKMILNLGSAFNRLITSRSTRV